MLSQTISGQTLNRLEEWVKDEAPSSRFFDFYKRLLQIQSEVEDSIKIPKSELINKTIYKRIVKGTPLLDIEDLVRNLPLMRDTFGRVIAALAEFQDLFGDIPKVLLKEEPQKRLTKKMVESWFKGKNLPSKLAGEEIKPALLDLLVHQSLRPFLIKYAQVFNSRVKQEKWQRGYCPVCGGKPDISYLEKEAGAKWLVCSRCDTQWHFKRLVCQNCGNQNPESMTYFVDDDEIYRLYVCDMCQTYLKTVDLRKAKTQVFLPLERLLTLDIDRQGQEKGYHPSYLQTNDAL